METTGVTPPGGIQARGTDRTEAPLRLSTLLLALATSACAPDAPQTSDPPAVVDLAKVPVTPGPPVTRRLTRSEYLASAAALFGDSLKLSVALEPDTRTAGLTALGAGLAATSPRGVEEYEVAAYDLAAQAVAPARRAAWVDCAPAAPTDDACASAALRSLARRAWRRPPTDEEVAELVAVTGQASEALGDFWAGLEYGVAAVLQSPYFLMRVERGEPDPAGGWRLSAWELATRLAFLLTNAPPDDALLAAAEQGVLDEADGVDAEAGRLLAGARGRDGLRAWLTDLLQLDKLDRLDKDPDLFPNISPTLGASAREETLRTAEHLVFDEDADLREVLTTRTTFVNRELAAVYAVPAPSLDGFAQITLPADGPRRGMLGQVSFLALHSHSTATSATLRGYALREELLCDPPPPPPSGVNTSIPESTGERPTLRDRVEAHLRNPSCSTCHESMDLLGLPLENFDAVGRWRDDEAGHPIDATGSLDGVDFDGPSEMAEVLAADPALTDCLTRQLVRRALGREPGLGEEEMVAALTRSFVARDARLQPLWLDLVTSPLFRRLDAP